MFVLIFTFLLALIREYTGMLTGVLMNRLSQVTEDEKRLLQSHSQLSAELSRIPMKEDYVNYIRLERKITKVKQELESKKSERLSREDGLRSKISRSLYALLAVSFAILMYFQGFRNSVHVLKNEEWFFPIQGLLSLSTSDVGGVGLPIWMYVSTNVIRAFKI
eukprot:TRINITY_DN1498_c0_g1_i3.p2 TRINITY_DN1498_c0_g1~~TRINITY_DN1498_c0_g1_i3.p2  ORF type:complete len:163 (+),score=16.08 TRINITY_DN1498_c0_g1_i3:154-642(+)